MARGRFIDKAICIDKKVNNLSCPDSILGFTWLITHLDREGRTYGDPAIVKSLIFPRRNDIDTEKMGGFIKEWNGVGLIKVYEVNGEQFICFPKFDKYQVGLRKDREPSSNIPAPCDKKRKFGTFPAMKLSGNLPATIQQSSGNNPAEVKLIKGEVKSAEISKKTEISARSDEKDKKFDEYLLKSAQNQNKKESVLLQYPPQYQELLKQFSELFNINLPRKNERDFKSWISGMDAFIKACSDNDPSAKMQEIYQDWNLKGRNFLITSPFSIISLARINKKPEKKLEFIHAPAGWDYKRDGLGIKEEKSGEDGN